ncbi:hypothetical protein [Arthrobacter sp. Leaf141]|nr:hypothetical protein [Arthrobacter sp. Leaf141]
MKKVIHFCSPFCGRDAFHVLPISLSIAVPLVKDLELVGKISFFVELAWW